MQPAVRDYLGRGFKAIKFGYGVLRDDMGLIDDERIEAGVLGKGGGELGHLRRQRDVPEVLPLTVADLHPPLHPEGVERPDPDPASQCLGPGGHAPRDPGRQAT